MLQAARRIFEPNRITGIARRTCWALICILSLTLNAVAQIAIQNAGAESSYSEIAAIDFDIPAQPLEEALMAYADATGVEVFVDHALAAGQRSSPVQGHYSVEVALRHLLAGSGLEFRRAARDAYTVVAIPAQEPPVGRTPNWSADSERQQFFAALQLAIKQTLCARPEISPGRYRAALAIWIGPTGQVVNTRMLSTSGKEDIPRTLVEGIQRISVGLPPPAGLEQPVTFVILPRSSDRTGDCAARNTRRG